MIAAPEPSNAPRKSKVSLRQRLISRSAQRRSLLALVGSGCRTFRVCHLRAGAAIPAWGKLPVSHTERQRDWHGQRSALNDQANSRSSAPSLCHSTALLRLRRLAVLSIKARGRTRPLDDGVITLILGRQTTSCADEVGCGPTPARDGPMAIVLRGLSWPVRMRSTPSRAGSAR
jgi:hypothetical protein